MVLSQIWTVLLVSILHIYVFWNLFAGSFKLGGYRIILGVISVCVILLYIRVPNWQPYRILYYSFMLWFGFILILSMFSFLYQILELIGLISKNNKPMFIIISTLLIYIYAFINASIVHVSPTTIHFKGHPTLSTTRVVHLTDLHLGSVYRRRFTELICNKIREIDPDFVVITGDLFDGNIEFEYELIEPFDHLEIPIYFVAGNHDLYYPNEITEVINKSKMIRLNDTTITFNEIKLIGFDFRYEGRGLYRKLLELGLNSNMVNIVLYHAPVLDVDLLSELNVGLYLAGHTHGGQMFPMDLFMMLKGIYVSGIYHSENYESYVHVSPGLGTTKTPLRIGTRPTISLLTLCNEE